MRSITLEAIVITRSAAAVSTVAMAQEVYPCTRQIDTALRPHGFTAAQLHDVNWQPELYENSKSPQMGGYHLEARVGSCPSARVSIELWRSCQVRSVDPHGSCSDQQATR